MPIWILDIAVVDDEKAIREHICGLMEEQKPARSLREKQGDTVLVFITGIKEYVIKLYLFIDHRDLCGDG